MRIQVNAVIEVSVNLEPFSADRKCKIFLPLHVRNFPISTSNIQVNTDTL